MPASISKMNMNKDATIYIAGHSGMVGSAIWRNLESVGYTNLIGKRSNELDLRSQNAVADFFKENKPEYVFLAAAKVGGIVANNTYRAQFLYENLMIEANVIHESYLHGVKKLIFLGSSCIYPKLAPQPMEESVLLTGSLEPTNEPYAIAKIAGIKLCETYRDQYGCHFISAMPTNLYGPNDNYDLENSHVIPALIRKFHEAKINGQETVTIWGSGSPKREFLHVDDLARACVHMMMNYDSKELVNVGTGEDISIKDLALMIKEVTGFTGGLHFDVSRPDGTPRKLLNTNKINSLGWQPQISLKEGLDLTYSDYIQTN